MKILVTGAAGFIGTHLSIKLLNQKNKVIGVDNLNNYYSPKLKKLRLAEIKRHDSLNQFDFYKLDISNRAKMMNLFKNENFDVVINLAAQAGVRHSLNDPHSYIHSNIDGFLNILEGCRHNNVKHLIYASSSSVYGMNVKQPFSTDDRTDFPVSLYAATKKSNEVMAHAYSHLYDIKATGLRFFTVYGPFGRPDMAYYMFTKKILDREEIDIFNNGEMRRDFTYIDDIIEAICRLINKPPERDSNKFSASKPFHKIYNIGNNNPVSLSDFVSAIEKSCGLEARKNYCPMQPGDVPTTYANIDDLKEDFDFSPKTSIDDGIYKFVKWYVDTKL